MTEHDRELIEEARILFGNKAAAEMAEQIGARYQAHADELRRFKAERQSRR